MTRIDYKNITALITGASSGIGEAFARNLAKRGADLILVARSEDELTRLAEALREAHQGSVHVLPMDLTLDSAPQQVYNATKSLGLSVDLLINNAGFGKWTHFLDESLSTYEHMVSLNISALMKLTYLWLPEISANGKGGVINVASTAAFQPIPYQAVYAATKSFVLSFTEALAGEYRDSDLTFLALCPGNTTTRFMAVANAHTDGMSFATPEAVAEAGLEAFAKHKSYLVYGGTNYLYSLLPRFLSRASVIRVVAGMFKNRVSTNNKGSQ